MKGQRQIAIVLLYNKEHVASNKCPLFVATQVRYSDLCREGQRIMRKGIWQVLPSRDSTGRLVVTTQGWISDPTAAMRVSFLCVRKRQIRMIDTVFV